MKQQLRVFVSSTIGECTAERAAAKAAIMSTRHHPVLFEELGSHPYPPRKLYLRELQSADVFVGIYRESYGWVAPNAKISGLDDEHKLRSKLGLPPLIYILRPAPNRESRLARIVEEAEQSTVTYYADPAELQERIAADLTAIVAQAFNASQIMDDGGPDFEETPDGKKPTLNKLESLDIELLSSLVVAGGRLTVEELADSVNEKATAVLRSLTRIGDSALSMSGNIVTLARSPSITAETYHLLSSQAETQFYAHRIAIILERKNRLVDAYKLFQSINHPRADVLLAPAAREATMAGRTVVALPLLRKNVERAKEHDDDDVAVSFLLSIAILSMDAGEGANAAAALQEAHTFTAPDLDLALRAVELHRRAEVLGDQSAVRELDSLRTDFETDGDKQGSARVALIQSKIMIDLHQFRAAAEHARFALKVFTDSGDSHGCHVAQHNLLAALSALSGNDDEVSQLRATLAEAEVETPRMRAFACNLEARRLRDTGKPAAAAVLSREAIAIGRNLGDVRLQLTNTINLGNALSDLGQTDEAVAEYKNASALAASASLRLIEGSATRLIATTLNEAERAADALPFAQHAAGLLRDTIDSRNFVKAKWEEATAHGSLGSIEDALTSYREAGAAARRFEHHSDLGSILLELAELKSASNEAVVNAVLAICGEDSDQTPPEAVFSLAEHIGSLLAGMPAELRGRLTRSLFERALFNCPQALLARFVGSIIDRILQRLVGAQSSQLQILANLLAAFDPGRLSMWQWNVIADKCAAKFPALAFKPFDDGAAHWTVVPDERLVATISELDDGPVAFAATLCVALALAALGPDYLDALGSTELPRREAALHVTTRSEFVAMISAAHAPEPGRFVTVSRAANESDPEPPPMHAIIDDDLVLGPLDALDGVTGANLLLSKSMYEMARHLLGGKVSEDALIRRLRPVIFTFYA